MPESRHRYQSPAALEIRCMSISRSTSRSSTSRDRAYSSAWRRIASISISNIGESTSGSHCSSSNWIARVGCAIRPAVLSLGGCGGGHGAQKVLNCSHIFIAGFVTQIQHYSSGMFGIATDARYFRHAVLSLGVVEFFQLLVDGVLPR